MGIFQMNPDEGLGSALQVTGDPDPDSTGYYFKAATWNDWRIYERSDDAYYLWADANDQHYITTVVDELGPGFWANQSAGPAGDFPGQAPYSGTATVHRRPTKSPLGVGTTSTIKLKDQWHGRRTGRRTKPVTVRESRVRTVLERCVRLWNELSPALKLIWIGDGLRPLINRTREKFLARGLRRWIQVQMPLMLAGLPLEASTKQRTPYQVRDLHVSLINDEGTQAELTWDFNRASTIPERVVLHVSQLNPRLFAQEHVAKYSRLIHTSDYSVWAQDPGWFTFWQWVPLAYRCDRGTSIQLYARFELMDNPAPPASAIGSLMTTEDWGPLNYFRDL